MACATRRLSLLVVLISLFLLHCSAFLASSSTRLQATSPVQLLGRQARSLNGVRSLKCEIELFGTQGSRSPLVNWYLHEIGQEFKVLPPAQSPHPFGQIPYLRDGQVEVFESGAILQYLADKYGGEDTPEKRAKTAKWVVWANATLDPIIFSMTARGGGLRSECKQMVILDNILAESDYLTGSNFTVADAAVGSYLLYIWQFFPDVSLARYPRVVAYMARLAGRPAYRRAFGDRVTDFLLQKCEVDASSGESGSSSGGKKFMGLF
mmetsp:Transcript_28342/g.51176  ORF Transcript_28342/g.51176 Transcript_28342/m.51176 type:complete len:265 (+) Transcript_28342:57-851(+)